MFNFKRLVKKYSKYPVYLLEETEGYYDPSKGGEWVEGKIEKRQIEGAVVPLSNEDLRYDQGGTYSFEDRKLYCYVDIAKGEKIKHKEKDYTVLERRDYSDFDAELRIYFIKRGERD